MKQRTRGVTAIPEIRPRKKGSSERYHIFIYKDDFNRWYWVMQKRGRLVAQSGMYADIGKVNRSAALMQDSICEEVRGPIHYPAHHNYSGG